MLVLEASRYSCKGVFLRASDQNQSKCRAQCLRLMTESETLMNTVQNTHEWSLACIIVSHFHWHKKQIVCLCLEGWRCSNSFAWLRAAIWPSSSLHLSPLLQDVWIVYLSVRPGLGKATARASADWCRSTAPPAVISVTVRSSSGNGSRSPGGRKKKKTEKVFSQLSSTRSCCEPFANGATGANRSSHAELRWRFSRVWFVGRLHLALGESVFYFWRVAAFQNAHTAGPLPVDCSLSEGCFTQELLIRQLPL